MVDSFHMEVNKHTAFSRQLGEMTDHARRSWRLSIYKETCKIIAAKTYRPPHSPPISLSLPTHPFSRTILSSSDLSPLQSPHLPTATAITIYEGDCLEAGIALKTQGLNPVILNMANPRIPGGGVRKGDGAQEENLFRRSTYSHFLYNNELARYPITETGAIYTPGVTVFRAAEAAEYALMENPVELAFIALPALFRPALTNDPMRGPWLARSAYDLAKEKIANFLKLGLSHGHQSVVFSAWGCGAFHNPPRCIATAFKEVLESEELQGRLVKVVFAIFDDHNAMKTHNPEGNVRPFADVFQVQPSTTLSSQD